MAEELRSAIVHLTQRPREVGKALGSLGICHRVFLRENNADGFNWSFRFLRGVIRTWFSLTPEGLEKLFNTLVTTCFHEIGLGADAEDSVALAAFTVGSQAFRGGKHDLAVEWFMKGHPAARTMLLKYELAFNLAIAFARQNKMDECLHWLAVAKDVHELTGLMDSGAMVLYTTGFFFAVLRKFDSARQISALLRTCDSSGMFCSALASMLDVECKYFERPSGISLEELIVDYSKVRRLLISSCMPNLEMMLAKFIGTSDCPQGLFLKLMDLDGFSQYLISEIMTTSKFEQAKPAFHVSDCFLAYELYRASRKRLIQLQGMAGAVESFMDPRPHIEEALEKYWDKQIDLPSILLAHQVSLKAGHITCFLLAGELLALLSDSSMETNKLFSVLSLAFTDKCAGEDPEAWAAYHMGSVSWILGLLKKPDIAYPFKSEDIAGARYSFLERSLSQARTPTLRSLAALNLSVATHDFGKRLDLLEISKDNAMQAGHEDLIIQTSYHLFMELCFSRKYEKMNNLLEQLNNLVGEIFSSSCLLALVKHMEGYLQLCVELMNNKSPAYESLKQCLGILPAYQLTTPQVHYRYFTSQEDNWSPTRNYYMQHVVQRTKAEVEVEFCQTGLHQYQSRAPDARNLFYHMKRLIGAYKLEEAEAVGAELLEVLDEGEQLLAYVLLLLVQLSGRYYKRDFRDGCTIADTECVAQNLTQIMESFVEAALAIAKDTNGPHLISEAYWYHSIGFDLLGKGLQCMEKMQKSLKVLMEEDVNFGMFSSGRISYLDNFLDRFQTLQLALIQLGEIGEENQGTLRSLVWSERYRARDFMYKLRNSDRDMYLKELAAFDSDEGKALEEIMTLLGILGQYTVVLVITQYRLEEEGDWILLTYFLHQSKVIVRRQPLAAQDWVFVTEKLQHLVVTTEDCFGDVTFREYFGTLYDVLIKPFAVELEEVIKAKRIVFVPSKEMSTIPFSLLLDASTDEFLIQRYAVSVSSSLRLLKHCELRRQELIATAGSQCSALVVGDPTNDLEKASEEAQTLASFLRSKPGCSTTELHNESATKEAVLEQLPVSDWIHVASHCIVNQEVPDGALILASTRLTTEATLEQQEEDIMRTLRASKDSERLYGDEIVKHCRNSMSRAWGAVLSACASGVGRKFAEGILALPRSFHMCGVPSVVVSLWPVSDESTNELMQIMYRNLLDGKEIAEALQLAMVQMLLQVDRLGNPMYTVRQWAPFVVSGSCFTMHPFCLLKGK